MNLEGARRLAREGRLYPAVILHGADQADRLAATTDLARILLCAAPPEERPCGDCRHCRRIAIADPGEDGPFHPDFQVLHRDLKTSTSVAATKELVRAVQLSPFEARGQVLVVASAETLSGEAANSLLKALEEPSESAPRHFFLLAPSRLDLLPTLQSRALSIYLGPAEALDQETVEELAGRLARCVTGFADTGSAVYLLAAADALKAAGGWDDPRAGRPWAVASAAVVRSLDLEVPPGLRRPLLDLAEALLEAPAMRLRAVGPERILEGLLARYLAPAPGRGGLAPAPRGQ